MKIRWSFALIIFMVLNWYHVIAQNQEDAAIERLEKIINHYVQERDFSGSIIIEKDQKTILSSGFGFAQKEREVPFKSSTAFSIGTLSQHFNAVALMLLHEAGKLQISDPISKYFEEVPKDKRSLTIHHLLSHTSGLPDFYAGNRSDHFKVGRKEAVRNILKLELLSKPGRKFSVSNSGYILLAAIVEEVTGHPYREFIQRELFDRVGMYDSGFHGDQIWDSEQIARGYGFNEKNKNLPNEWPEPSWMIIGASDIVSTGEDLYKWWNSLLNEEIVSPSSLELMMQEHALDRTKRFIRYGYGFKYKETEYGPVWYYNGGGEYGQICSLRFYPESNHKIVLLSNYYKDLNPLASVVINQIERAIYDPESLFLRGQPGE